MKPALLAIPWLAACTLWLTAAACWATLYTAMPGAGSYGTIGTFAAVLATWLTMPVALEWWWGR